MRVDLPLQGAAFQVDGERPVGDQPLDPELPDGRVREDARPLVLQDREEHGPGGAPVREEGVCGEAPLGEDARRGAAAEVLHEPAVETRGLFHGDDGLEDDGVRELLLRGSCGVVVRGAGRGGGLGGGGCAVVVDLLDRPFQEAVGAVRGPEGGLWLEGEEEAHSLPEGVVRRREERGLAHAGFLAEGAEEL